MDVDAPDVNVPSEVEVFAQSVKSTYEEAVDDGRLEEDVDFVDHVLLPLERAAPTGTDSAGAGPLLSVRQVAELFTKLGRHLAPEIWRLGERLVDRQWQRDESESSDGGQEATPDDTDDLTSRLSNIRRKLVYGKRKKTVRRLSAESIAKGAHTPSCRGTEQPSTDPPCAKPDLGEVQMFEPQNLRLNGFRPDNKGFVAAPPSYVRLTDRGRGCTDEVLASQFEEGAICFLIDGRTSHHDPE